MDYRPESPLAPAAQPSGGDPVSAASAIAPELDALTALAEMVAAAPAEVARRASACSAQLRAAGDGLEASGQPRLLPLIRETELTLSQLSGNLGVNGCAAVAGAMDLLAQALRTTPSPTRELITIAELRSVRGTEPPWRNPLIDFESPPPDATVSADGDPDVIASTLTAYRKSLLRLLKAVPVAEAARLSELSSRVAAACGDAEEQKRWRAAAAFFTAAATAGEAGRPLVKRLAAKLEQALRRLSEGAATGRQSGDALVQDLTIVAALLRAGAAAELPLNVNATALDEALRRLAGLPEDSGALLGQIADAFLIAGEYTRWLEASRLDAGAENAGAIVAAVSRWSIETERTDADAELSTRFEDARAALGRIESVLVPAGEAEEHMPARVSGVPVDRALLENLNLMAGEIRGARSRAEANLGSLRGGLVDMERTIRTLRAQLESLEVASCAEDTGSDGETSSSVVQGKFGALSRGIEELAGLKDALQALTEETESALADQAGDDTELQQGLLKTRMMPVGAQFESLCQGVKRAAAQFGVTATLTARGAEVALERSQMDALVRVLDPLLEACVREGLTAGASAALKHPDNGRLELKLSQPRFDVLVDIFYRGAALNRDVLSPLSPALNALGAVAASSVDGEGRARVSLRIPGPPQPMELLLIELGQSRLALPLRDISGVTTSLPETAGEDGDGMLSFEGERYRPTSLARVLDLESSDGPRNAWVMVTRGESRLALSVDKVVGRRRMLVSSPGPVAGSSPWVLGAVIDALAAPTLVLNLDALVLEEASEPA